MTRKALGGARWRASAALRPGLVNGTAGLITMDHGEPFAIRSFTITGGKNRDIGIVSEAGRLRPLGLAPR